MEGEWLNGLIGLLQAVQLGLLRLLAWLGLVGLQHGQPAWPWAWRLSGENLLIDLGQARRLAVSVAGLAAVAALLLIGFCWRRRRGWLLAAAVLLLLAMPWPDGNVVRVVATPASFHRSPTGFTAMSIVQGRALYARYCVGCHGADGRGQGTQAAALPVWPPNLAGPLLWRRADGDLLWHVLHGMRDRRGAVSMPAFGERLNDAQAWALIDFMKAQAAGETLRATGAWALPAALPDATVRCEGQPSRRLSSWRGQRLRIVAPGDAQAAPLREDPRLVTVRLRPASSAGEPSGAAPQPDLGCVIDAPEAWDAFSLIAGTHALAGTSLLADRDGWLRARNRQGQADWSDDDLVCRTDVAPRGAAAGPGTAVDGLGALIARMDAEPVRYVKGGFVH